MKKELMTLAQEIAQKTQLSKVDKYGMSSIEHATAVAERMKNAKAINNINPFIIEKRNSSSRKHIVINNRETDELVRKRTSKATYTHNQLVA